MKNSKEKNHDWKSGLYLWIKSSVVAHFKYLVAAIFIFAFVFAFLFQCLYLFHTDVNSARYMLSALVQSQAAIVAIVITLTLIAVQLTASAYSPRVVDVFRKNPGMWILLLLYGTSIFYGLIVLRLIEGNKGELVNQSVIWSFGHSITLDCCITLAFWLGIVAFVALIPYILYITDLLKPEKIIKELANGITKNKEYNSSKDPIQPIVDIIRGSIRKYDFETTKEGLKEVTNQVIKVVDLDCGEGISNSFCTRLQGVGKLAASVTDEESTIEVIENLERFGKDTARNKLEVATKRAIPALEAVGIAAVRKGTELEDATEQAAKSLGVVGEAAAKNKLGEATEEVAESLGAFGELAAENELKIATKQVANSLGDVGKIAAKEKLNDVTIRIAESLGGVGKIAADKGLKAATSEAISSLEIVGTTAAENKLKAATESAVSFLGVVGVEAVNKGEQLGEEVGQALSSLENLGEVATWKTILSLRNVGEAAVEEGKELEVQIKQAARSLETIGKATAKKGEEHEIDIVEAAQSLESIGKAAADKELEDVVTRVAWSLLEVGTTVVEMKELKMATVQAANSLAELTSLSKKIVETTISDYEKTFNGLDSTSFQKFKELYGRESEKMKANAT